MGGPRSLFRLAVGIVLAASCLGGYELPSSDTRAQHLMHLTPSDQSSLEVFQHVALLYSGSRRVEVRVHPFAWHSSVEHVYYPDVDRSCLLHQAKARPVVSKYFGDYTVEALVLFINEKANEFVSVNGGLTAAGELIQRAEAQAFRSNGGECERISAADLTATRFMHEYVLPQKPVIITDIHVLSPAEGVQFLEGSLDDRVHVKLSDSISFEGIEPLSAWWAAEDSADAIPEQVLSQIESPDRVVVRAAHSDMTVQQVLSHFANAEQQLNQSVHLYVEYFETRSKLALLDQLVASRMPHWARHLRDGRQYLWLGGGRTIGRFHFDPFDNLMFVVDGAKTFHLIDASDNQRLYEGHMREAQLELVSGRFRRAKLLEATSMVHTPLEFDEPDFHRYPRARAAFESTMRCRASAGEAIYVPSYWWHEVQSESGKKRLLRPSDGLSLEVRYNLAVNVWFDPVFSKAFPCATCPKEFNARYREVIEELARKAE